MKYTYLLINIFSSLVPFLFSFHPKIRFDRQFKAFGKATFITSVIFITWDVIFTKSGVWSFNSDYTMGIRLFGLPLEEILFFICIPFACVFTYYCFTRFYFWNLNRRVVDCIIILVAVTLLLFGINYSDRLYTLVTFISTALFLLALTFLVRPAWTGKFLVVYLVLLVPFLIVNGLLTGTFLPEPVVLYNPDEFIGIRLLSIPLEDAFYGLELIYLNVFLFERFRNAEK